MKKKKSKFLESQKYTEKPYHEKLEKEERQGERETKFVRRLGLSYPALGGSRTE